MRALRIGWVTGLVILAAAFLLGLGLCSLRAEDREPLSVPVPRVVTEDQESGPSNRVSFLGLVSFVSQGKPMEDKVWVLLPNAQEPDNLNVGYKGGFFFDVEHVPRIVLLKGRVDSTWSKEIICIRGSKKKLETLPLDGRQVVFSGDGVVIDRSPVGMENPTKSTSVNLLANMNHLMMILENQENTAIGSFDKKILEGKYDASPRRLASRIVVKRGSIRALRLWGTKYQSVKGFIFHAWNGRDLGSVKNTSRLMATGLSLELPSGSLSFELCDLKELKCSTVTVSPDEGEVSLAIINSPKPGSCSTPDADFAAHYLLYDNYADVKKVLVPGTADLSGGSSDNAQCSPVDYTYQ